MPWDVPKIIDSAVKAPLWIFFALAFVSGWLVLNPGQILSDDDIATIESTTGPAPIWLVLFTSFFLSSLAARTGLTLLRALKDDASFLWMRVSIWRLSSASRATLALFEIEAAQQLPLVASSEHIVALRDSGLIEPNSVGQNEEWGTFRLCRRLDRLRRNSPKLFRAITRASSEDANGARKSMMVAYHRSKKLVASR